MLRRGRRKMGRRFRWVRADAGDIACAGGSARMPVFDQQGLRVAQWRPQAGFRGFDGPLREQSRTQSALLGAFEFAIALMNEVLPKFQYHPDPIATGMVQASQAQCACCDRVRGLIYVGPVYGELDLHESLCPWCIADGSADRKLGASFADAHSLQKAGVTREVIDEVNLRTPAFTSWQQEEWLTHCNDACEFLGDASASEIAEATTEAKQAWQAHFGLAASAWDELTQLYVPGGDQALYKFRCLHCKAVRFGWDCS